MITTVLTWRDCMVCRGAGEVELCADTRGEPDYLFGRPTGLWVPCQYCSGSGLEPDEVLRSDGR
ncbi:MAG: hypothetical protein HYU60_00340 [Magnetospirillum sp.]|nr:hypothetical protein [Magnetospirillum sp.]